MSILTLGSTNPAFSYVISKNPATIRDSGKAFRRELRKGVVYGWFPTQSDDTFRLWFKDAEVQSSFAQGASEEFEYLDCSRYGSPYLPIAIITNTLASAAKEQHEQDVDASAWIETAIKVPNPRYLDQLITHYLGSAAISYEPLHGHYVKIHIQAPTVFAVLNVLQVVCVLQCLCDEDTYVRMDEATLSKFVKVFNRAEAPYYPRYLFQMKAISNRQTFDKLKPDLETDDMKLSYGDTRQQRFDAIRKVLTGGKTLIDIGCGELFQSLRLASNYEMVYAVEADEDRAANNDGKIKGRKVENVVGWHAEASPKWVDDNAGMFEDADVLMTEVAEHLTTEAADSLAAKILASDVNTFVITCPNKDFNVYYGLSDEEMRHPDHKWEPTFEEFCDWTVTLAAEAGYSVENYGIGDHCYDSPTSILAVFRKPKKEEAA